MSPAADTVHNYFNALNARDLETAAAMWSHGGVERVVGQEEVTAPGGVRAYFTSLFAAFPDWSFQILETTTSVHRVAVRWRARATFAGPGHFQGFAPNGATLDLEGCDMMTIVEGRIDHNDVYFDSATVARQLGVLPEAESRAQARLAKLANARTLVRERLRGVIEESIAPGVRVVRGGRPRTMNVYLIDDGDGVTVFDAGISEMGPGLRASCARHGGVRRVILGHADADHRGAAPALPGSVYCHPAEVQAAESASSFRPYWDLSRLAAPVAKVYPSLLRHWDGGAVEIAGTVEEGEVVAGFRVVHLPGHAPGLIGLFRDSDRLALVSDCFYTIDPQTGLKNAAHVPHPAFNEDTEQARASIRKLAALGPSAAWAGHANPVAGDDVPGQLERAAAAPV